MSKWVSFLVILAQVTWPAPDRSTRWKYFAEVFIGN